ncbi:MAG: hypothetical protein LBI62_09010 [Candidatus Accumulibacter sp.]|nr:hypothetical protein [Accumulibacter sp.]
MKRTGCFSADCQGSGIRCQGSGIRDQKMLPAALPPRECWGRVILLPHWYFAPLLRGAGESFPCRGV